LLTLVSVAGVVLFASVSALLVWFYLHQCQKWHVRFGLRQQRVRAVIIKIEHFFVGAEREFTKRDIGLPADEFQSDNQQGGCCTHCQHHRANQQQQQQHQQQRPRSRNRSSPAFSVQSPVTPTQLPSRNVLVADVEELIHNDFLEPIIESGTMQPQQRRMTTSTLEVVEEERTPQNSPSPIGPYLPDIHHNQKVL
jgi:hypothetical protein